LALVPGFEHDLFVSYALEQIFRCGEQATSEAIAAFNNATGVEVVEENDCPERHARVQCG
jgi:hypothetical protein